MTKQNIRKYYSDWEGWYCEVEDENGECCGEVISNDRGDLQAHLKEKHKINVELEI